MRQTIKIVIGAAHRHTLLEIAGDDRLRCAPNCLDTLEQSQTLSAIPPILPSTITAPKADAKPVKNICHWFVDLLAIGRDGENGVPPESVLTEDAAIADVTVGFFGIYIGPA